MSGPCFAALAALVCLTMAAVDFAHARYSLAMYDHRREAHRSSGWIRRPLVAAAMWSVVQWGAASVAFVVTVRVSMWFLPFEALGLVLGTLIGGRRTPSSRVEGA